jgi:hypothetical protein
MKDWEALGSFVRRKAHGQPQAHSPTPEVQQAVCSECSKSYLQGDMIRIQNAWVCANCKPIFLQKIKEGVKPGAGSRLKGYGSLEKGIKGQYDLAVFEIISEAWQMTQGSKLIIIGSLLLVWIISALLQNVISIPLTFMIGILAVFFEKTIGNAESAIFFIGIIVATGMFMGILTIMLQAPLWTGLEMIGVRRSVDLPISFRYVFDYFRQFIPLALTWLLMSSFIILGFMLCVIPGIYLGVASFLALQLVADKKLGPWQAFKTSIKAVTHKWFHVFFLLILLFGLMAISAIPLGIGLIWTWPLFIIAKGVLYRNIFGVEQPAH